MRGALDLKQSKLDDRIIAFPMAFCMVWSWMVFDRMFSKGKIC